MLATLLLQVAGPKTVSVAACCAHVMDGPQPISSLQIALKQIIVCFSLLNIGRAADSPIYTPL